MKSRVPARTAPTGAPSPFEKSIQTESKSAPYAFACTPVATTAFMSRAPSQWRHRPYSLASAQMSRIVS